MTDPSPQWGLIEVALQPRRESAEAHAADLDALEEIGSLVAAEEGVTGVELRDPNTFDAVEQPHLLVYTEVDALDARTASVQRWTRDRELEVRIRAEIRRGDAWRDAWKEYYRPQIFGTDGARQLLVRPSWIERRPGDPSREIILDPGRAFGTGLHASTRLCLQWLCHVPAVEGPVLDLGCGSGILALAAARLFELSVVATDVDPEATETTRENATLNQLEGRVEARVGGLDSITAPPRFATIIANIRPSVLIPMAPELVGIIANIRPSVLIPMAPELVGRLAAGGRAVLSGILTDEADDVQAAYENAGARAQQWRVLEEWCAITLEHGTP